MWWLISKKRFKKELKKIGDSFRSRDVEIKEIKAEIVSKETIKLMIENEILKVQSEPNSALNSEQLKSEKHFDKAVLLKAKKTRPDMIKIAIRGLIERDMRTTDIFNIVVNEKKLCGKTQFYHYLSIVKLELRTPVRAELRTKLKDK